MTSKARNIADLGSNDVIETTSTGVDVTGTVTADGLTVENTGVIAASFNGGSAATYVRWSDATDNWFIGTNTGLGGMLFKNETADANRFFIGSNGDVSFYEDTGTTAKMVWDASAEELEIGSSTDKLELGASFQRFRKGNENKILIGNTSSALGSGTGLINYLYDPEPFIWYQGAERMRIDSTGNVGIGTASPSNYSSYNGLTIADTAGGFVDMKSTTGSITAFISADNGAGGGVVGTRTNDPLQLRTNDIERARIDSSGNLLVGSTSTANGTPYVTSGKVQGSLFTSNNYSVDNVGSTFVSSGLSVGNTRGAWIVTIQGSADTNGSSIATYILTKAAYDTELVQLGNTASHFHNVYVEAQLSSPSASAVTVRVRFTGSNLTGTGTIFTSAMRIG
jgi:hypothetical protein